MKRLPRALETAILRSPGVTVNGVPVVKRPATTTMPVSPTAFRNEWRITFTALAEIVSTANRRDHWTVLRHRSTTQKDAIAKALRSMGIHGVGPLLPGPVVVEMVRVYGRRGKAMDDDNLANGFKAVQDMIAEWLDVDDGNREQVAWVRSQEPGERNAVRITITGNAA